MPRKLSSRHISHRSAVLNHTAVNRILSRQRVERLSGNDARAQTVETCLIHIVLCHILAERQHDVACEHICLQMLIELFAHSLLRNSVAKIRHSQLVAVALIFFFERCCGVNSRCLCVSHFQLISDKHIEIFLQRLLRHLLLIVFVVHIFKFRQRHGLAVNFHQNRIFLRRSKCNNESCCKKCSYKQFCPSHFFSFI